ncbi:MAG TPA: DUF4112 domain-containing protein [Caulobacteraceae bacterium]|nr:DUF4112 domain-containing protein [Caulobacteraceae bacterium]
MTMLRAKSEIDVHNARRTIELIGRLSDNLIGWGPFGIGLDGILAWVPGLGEVYSVVAGAALIFEGWRARVPASVLVQAALLVSVRTLADLFPVLGSIVVDFFRGHRIAAKMIKHAIDETLYIQGEESADHPEYRATLARVREGMEWRRVVFLGAPTTSIYRAPA